MASLGSKLGSAFIEVSPSFSGFNTALQHGLSTAFGSTLATVGSSLESIGKKLFTKFTVPLAAATAANVAQFQALDREIRTTLTLFGTVPSLVDKTWGQMAEGVRGVSKEVGGLERDIADGLYQAISAGIPKGDVFEFLDVAQMAAMADKTADMTTAVDGITTAINAFGLEADDAADVSDVMFATVAKGKTTFGELSQSMGRAAGLAANAGVEFEEFSAVIGAITLSGFQTSEAVSFLRASITGLLRPSEEMNAIFQEVGFATAEAAVPVIGLQQAMQTVVDAAGGSTSKLQELIGTSEGVSAILAITGDNADKFAGVLSGTENAAGAAANAYEIMEGAVGRSFGRMTEAFDRLGNQLGKYASKIVAPIADIITDVVDIVSDVFKNLEPVIDTFTDAIRGVFKVFDIPGVKQLISVLTTVGVTMSGMMGVVGALALTFGKLFIVVGKGTAFSVLVGAMRRFVSYTKTNIPVVYDIFRKLGEWLSVKFPATAGRFISTTGKITRAAGNMRLAMLGLGGIFLGITAAVAAGTIAYQKYKNHMESVRDRALVTTRGIDALADSLGIVLDTAQEIDFSNLTAGEIGVDVIGQNVGVVEKIMDVVDRLGEAEGRDYILDVALQFQEGGATPEQITGMVDYLQDATNIDFAFNMDMVVDENAFNRMRAQAEYLDALSDKDFRLEGPFGGEFKTDIQDLADLVARIGQEQGPEAMLDALRELEPVLERDLDVMNYFSDEVIKSFQDISDTDLGLDTIFHTDIQGVIAQLEGIPGFENIVESAREAAAETGKFARDVMTVEEEFAEQARSSALLVDNTKQQLQIQGDLINQIPGIFEKAGAHIQTVFDGIHDGLVSQMPVLDVYTGAVKQSFDEWKKGQDQFQKDIVNVSNLREELKKMPPEVLAAFDAASLDKQAWLANLGATEQAEAITEMTESYDAVTEATKNVWEVEVPGAIAGAQSIIDTEYATMLGAAESAGGDVGFHFARHFETQAQKWPGIAATYLGQVRAILMGGVGVPTITGPSFTPEITVSNTTVNVTSTAPSSNAGQQVSRALQQVPG